MFRVLENIVHFNSAACSTLKNEERVLAVMRFKAHAEVFALWAADNCGGRSIIILQQAIGLLERDDTSNNKKWKTIRIYQPLALIQKGKE